MSKTKTKTKRVREAFDADVLKRVCELDDFSEYAPRFDLHGKDRFYHYKDNGSNILAVAHLDHVQDDGTCQVVDTGAGLLALSGALDDRLGAYVILELLPKLGITFDWLLTTDEEKGASTASEFEPTKHYNWIIEFDRGGTDVVMYDYETKELKDLVEESGARVGMGIWSDICVLEHLECAAFNWGVGYTDYHSPRSHAWLEDTFRMVARFMKFHSANADEYLPYDPFVGRYQDRWEDFDDEKLWIDHDPRRNGVGLSMDEASWGADLDDVIELREFNFDAIDDPRSDAHIEWILGRESA